MSSRLIAPNESSQFTSARPGRLLAFEAAEHTKPKLDGQPLMSIVSRRPSALSAAASCSRNCMKLAAPRTPRAAFARSAASTPCGS